MRRFILCGLLLGSVTCSSKSDPPPASSGAWDREIATPEAVDLDPDANVVEVRLTAKIASLEIRPGVRTDVWTYDGLLPGPRIRAKVGDRLKVHFTNALPAATSIHWHGVRVPNDMDGNGLPPVPPGGTFDYEFVLPDAGTFWYHPHVDAAAQVGFGLYGALVVEDPSEPHFGDEATMVLSDLGLDEAGKLTDPHAGGTLGDVFGREGELLLVNGKQRPTVHARAGAPQRWRLINAAKSRYYQLELEGHTMVRIGGDGGLRETPLPMTTLLLVPGERADLVVVPQKDAALRWIPFDRGYGSAFAREPEVVLDLKVDGAATSASAPIPARLRTLPPLDTSAAIHDTIALTQQGGDMTTFGINGKAHEAMVMAKVGETRVWEVQNQTEWDHPFHLHGFFFRPLDGSGAQVGEWKDTLQIPHRETRTVVVRFDERPGTWMFHCHILDHAEIGMMGMLMLE